MARKKKRVRSDIDFASFEAHSFSGNVLSPKSRRNRLMLIFAGAILWSGLIVWRLYTLQISQFNTWQDWALKQHFQEVKIASARGTIFDRNGKKIAVSVPSRSIYVRPKNIDNIDEASLAVAGVLDMEVTKVRSFMEQPKPFVWIKRQVPRVYARKIEALNIKGIGSTLESRRYYPYNEAAATLIGRVGIDGNGLSGLEMLYEKRLQGAEVKTTVVRDALGKQIQVNQNSGDEFELPKGRAMSLTIDAAIQSIVEEELERGRKRANAKAAMAVMLDSNTGEILALSQAPNVNFNSNKSFSKSQLKNLLVETIFEPGSILKPIVAAAALDTGVVDANEIIYCENGRLRVGRHTIKDVHALEDASFHDIVVQSSNIGMSKVAYRMGPDKLYGYLKNFGFGSSTSLGLPGETSGILRSNKGWANVDVATHSFGQGIAVTPLQMVRAISAIANGGNLPELRVVKSSEPYTLRRVISERAAHEAKEMMYGVVESEHGTGKKARLKGLRIGGKTGTAQKPKIGARGYQEGAYIASFIGFADGSPLGYDKTVTLMVAVDEPDTNSIYGGTLAAPVFKRIIKRSLHLYATRQHLIRPEIDEDNLAPSLLRRVSL